MDEYNGKYQEIAESCRKEFCDYVLIGVEITGRNFMSMNIGADNVSISNRERKLKMLGEIELLKMELINDIDKEEDDYYE